MTESFSRDLRRYLTARIPLIAVQTIERSRVLDTLTGWVSDYQCTGYVQTASGGVRDLVSGESVSQERTVVGALEWMAGAMAVREELTLVLTESQELHRESPLSHQLTDLVHLARDRGHTLVVQTHQPLWLPLQRLGISLRLEAPGLSEVKTLVGQLVDPYRGELEIEWGPVEIAEAAVVLQGLAHIEIENIIAALLADGRLSQQELGLLSRFKDRFVCDVRGMERIRVDKPPPYGGLSHLKTWLQRERQLLTMDFGDRELRPPRGTLLVGVPGCGKSLTARYVAGSWGLPLYRLDLGAIHGKYLGESEERLRAALKTADQAAPCILWIDEIEKGLAGVSHGNDGGAQARLVGHLLFWLQEARARVYIIATANQIESLPPELLRRGRFDAVFFVDLPAEVERREIIELYAQRYLRGEPLSPDLVRQLVDASVGFTGADIESAMRDIAREAILRKSDTPGPDALLCVFEQVVPFSQTSPEQVRAIRAWGQERARPASADATQAGDDTHNGGNGSE